MATTKIDRHGNRWRIRVISGGRTEVVEYRATRAAAEAYRERVRAHLAGITIEQTVEEYGRWLVERGHRGRPSSPQHARRTVDRLRSVYLPAMGKPPGWLSHARCDSLYEQMRTRDTKNGRPPSDTEQLNTLNQARTHGRWLVREGLAKVNPWERVEPVGKRKAGREQLTIDESRKLIKACLAECSPESIAVVLMIYCGLGVSEVLERTVRDLDDNARLLIVRGGKTASRKRVVELGPYGRLVEALASGKGSQERIWSHTRFQQLAHTKRLCEAAGVTVVDNHGLRGTAASLAVEGGGLVHAVSRALGHAGLAVTKRHYVRAQSWDLAKTRRSQRKLKE